MWENNNLDFFEWLKEIATDPPDLGENEAYIGTPKIRIRILEAAIARIESHLLHDKLFGGDELSKIEKLEEARGHGLSQMTNHFWIVNMYLIVLRNTEEGKQLTEYMQKI